MTSNKCKTFPKTVFSKKSVWCSKDGSQVLFHLKKEGDDESRFCFVPVKEEEEEVPFERDVTITQKGILIFLFCDREPCFDFRDTIPYLQTLYGWNKRGRKK
jgi:hypothetical protein